MESFRSGFKLFPWLPMSEVCCRLSLSWGFTLSGCSASPPVLCQLLSFVASSATYGNAVVFWLRRGKVWISFVLISMGRNTSAAPVSWYGNLVSYSSRGGIVGDGTGLSILVLFIMIWRSGHDVLGSCISIFFTFIAVPIFVRCGIASCTIGLWVFPP